MTIISEQKNKKYTLKEETKKRCQIIDVDKKMIQRYRPISLEQIQFLYDAQKIEFSVFLFVEEKIVEFIKPNELDKVLLDQLWEAVLKYGDHVKALVMKAQYPEFERIVEKIRQQKLQMLTVKSPELNTKTLDVYSNLSSVSQMIVKGGITSEVADRVRASASHLVSNLLDSDMAVATISRLINCDPTLYDHSASTALIAGVISGQIPKPLSEKNKAILVQAALYHDLGKTCVPSNILNKPAKLTPEEFDIIKTHSTLGHEELVLCISKGLPINEIAARVAKEHHERFSGGGYPDGKKGRLEDDPVNGIHPFSRIITVADVYSALLMKRVYKPAFDPQEAVRVMVGMKDHFDPEIFSAFVRKLIHGLNEFVKKGLSSARLLYFDEQGTLQEYKYEKKAG